MNYPSGENSYTILETISRSNHFCVYKAKNQSSGGIVTLKTTEQKWKGDRSLNSQLRDEAEMGHRLNHPNIRRTLGLFEDDGNPYLVSEYLDGDPLQEIISLYGAKLDRETILTWLLQLLDALDFAHGLGILHLNINPSNIIITAENSLKLFGFGKDPNVWTTAEPGPNQEHPVIFLAPEVFREQAPGEGSDVYSAGVLAYLLLCRQTPWTIDRRLTPSGQKKQSLQRPVLNPDLINKHVPHWLFTILNKALMLDPRKRFANAAAMAAAIKSQSVLPFESCLNMTSPELPPRQPAMEDRPAKKERNEAPEEVPPSKDALPEPEERAEKPEPKAAEPSPAVHPTPDAGSSGRGIPKPRPEAVKQESRPSGPRADRPKTQDRGELTSLQRIFRILALISMLIVAYVIVKYVVIRDREPSFSESDSLQNFVEESEFAVANVPLEMVLVPGDTTVIGHIGPEADDDEFPPREVYIPSFFISALETTRAEWAMVYRDYVFLDQDKDLPVTNVTFHEAVEYCNEKSILDKLEPCYDLTSDGVVCDFSANGYRLPTEAEWEYAAKGTERDDFTLYSGSEDPGAVAWYAANSGGEPHPVGRKRANSLGLHDMSGNVSEWTWNWYAPYSYNSSELFSGPGSGTDKAVRGGSWKDGASELRVTNRIPVKPYHQRDHIGFRVVRAQ